MREREGEREGVFFFYRYLKNVNRLLTSFTFNSDGVYENINIGTCRKKNCPLFKKSEFTN